MTLPTQLRWRRSRLHRGQMTPSGRIVVLNGAPRSGQSAIIEAIQHGSEGVWVPTSAKPSGGRLARPHHLHSDARRRQRAASPARRRRYPPVFSASVCDQPEDKTALPNNQTATASVKGKTS